MPRPPWQDGEEPGRWDPWWDLLLLLVVPLIVVAVGLIIVSR